MTESEEIREERARKLLEERVRRDTIVDGRLDGHDRKFDAINGQLMRGATATETVADRLGRVETAVAGLVAELKTGRTVDAALRVNDEMIAKKAEAVTKKTMGRREFWLSIAVVGLSALSILSQLGVL